MFLIAFPLLLIPFALYNMIVFLLDMRFSEELFTVPLMSGAPMAVTIGDFLIAIAAFLLYVEVLKSARLNSRSIMDHVLSLLLFLGMVAEFIVLPLAATSTFLMLLMLSFVDVLVGFSVGLRRPQPDIAVERVEPVD
jgi:hypothetical protein